MKAEQTRLKGCYLLYPDVFEDVRGNFFESFNQQKFNQIIGQSILFVQDNESFSERGVLRGLHFQKGEWAQAKLVRVVQGSVWDVVVDIRPNSPTFGESMGVELSEENRRQLFIPKGFAHGFVVLSKLAKFLYKCDNFYNKESEGGIIYNDTTLNIDWKLEYEKLIISEKDLALPKLENLEIL